MECTPTTIEGALKCSPLEDFVLRPEKTIPEFLNLRGPPNKAGLDIPHSLLVFDNGNRTNRDFLENALNFGTRPPIFVDWLTFPPHAQYRLPNPIERQAVNESRRGHEKTVPEKNLAQAWLGFPQEKTVSQ